MRGAGGGGSSHFAPHQSKGIESRLQAPTFTFNIAFVTLVLVVIVCVTPSTLTGVVVSSVEDTLSMYIPRWQQSDTEQVAFRIHAHLFQPMEDAVDIIVAEMMDASHDTHDEYIEDGRESDAEHFFDYWIEDGILHTRHTPAPSPVSNTTNQTNATVANETISAISGSSGSASSSSASALVNETNATNSSSGSASDLSGSAGSSSPGVRERKARLRFNASSSHVTPFFLGFEIVEEVALHLDDLCSTIGGGQRYLPWLLRSLNESQLLPFYSAGDSSSSSVGNVTKMNNTTNGTILELDVLRRLVIQSVTGQWLKNTTGLTVNETANNSTAAETLRVPSTWAIKQIRRINPHAAMNRNSTDGNSTQTTNNGSSIAASPLVLRVRNSTTSNTSTVSLGVNFSFVVPATTTPSDPNEQEQQQQSERSSSSGGSSSSEGPTEPLEATVHFNVVDFCASADTPFVLPDVMAEMAQYAPTNPIPSSGGHHIALLEGRDDLGLPATVTNELLPAAMREGFFLGTPIRVKKNLPPPNATNAPSNESASSSGSAVGSQASNATNSTPSADQYELYYPITFQRILWADFYYKNDSSAVPYNGSNSSGASSTGSASDSTDAMVNKSSSSSSPAVVRKEPIALLQLEHYVSASDIFELLLEDDSEENEQGNTVAVYDLEGKHLVACYVAGSEHQLVYTQVAAYDAALKYYMAERARQADRCSPIDDYIKVYGASMKEDLGISDLLQPSPAGGISSATGARSGSTGSSSDPDADVLYRSKDRIFALNFVTSVAVQQEGTAGEQRLPWAVVHSLPTSYYMVKILESRGKIIVTAFAIAAASVILLLMMLRAVLHPLNAISRAVRCCARMDLDRIEILEGSNIAEISEIQRSLSYLAIRLYHYQRFLPDRVVLGAAAKEQLLEDEDRERAAEAEDDEDALDELLQRRSYSTCLGITYNKPLGKRRRNRHSQGLDSDDDEYYDDEGGMESDEEEALGLGGTAGGEDWNDNERGFVDPLLVPMLTGEAPDGFAGAEGRSVLEGAQQGVGEKEPSHRVLLQVVYESRRQTADKTPLSVLASATSKYAQEQGKRTASFIFQHRVTDPVYSQLLRACRQRLDERPGEMLMLLAKTPDGRRLLTTDEDVLFAFEFFSKPGDLPVVDLVVRKASVRSIFPLLIAVSTVLSVLSRLNLSIERLQHYHTKVQLLGLVLASCIGMQLAQNIFISTYLVRRMNQLDDEFRAWYKDSHWESIMGILFGAFNVTNLELMSCQIRLGRKFRLNAPLTARLLDKIRKYSFVGFIIGDFVPFVVILIETVLNKRYQDPFVVLSVFFSVVSVVAILIRHGTLRFVMDAAVARTTSLSSQRTKTMLLSRKEVTVLRLDIAYVDELFAIMTPNEIDLFCERFCSAVLPIIRRFGGLPFPAEGSTISAVFNAHTVLPHHTRVAYDCYRVVYNAVNAQVFPDRYNDYLRKHRGEELPTEESLDSLRTHHRLIASIITGEQCVGYVGTLTSQSLQHCDWKEPLSEALCKLNQHYGTSILVNEEAAFGPEMDRKRADDDDEGPDHNHLSTARGFRRDAGNIAVLTRQIDVVSVKLHREDIGPFEVEEKQAPTTGGPQQPTARRVSMDFNANAESDTTAGRPVVGRPRGSSGGSSILGKMDSEFTFGAALSAEEAIASGSSRALVGDLLQQTETEEIGVYEIVLQDFNWVAPSSSTSGVDFSTHITSLRLDDRKMMHHVECLVGKPLTELPTQLDLRTIEIVKHSAAALGELFTVNNPAPLLKHYHQFPCDTTCGRVAYWGRFKGCRNERDALRFPRLITALGPQLHPCELVLVTGRAPMVPVDPEDANTQLLKKSGRSGGAGGKGGGIAGGGGNLRAPRSVRRLKNPKAASQVPVLARVIGEEHFSVDFGPAITDETVLHRGQGGGSFSPSSSRYPTRQNSSSLLMTNPASLEEGGIEEGGDLQQSPTGRLPQHRSPLSKKGAGQQQQQLKRKPQPQEPQQSPPSSPKGGGEQRRPRLDSQRLITDAGSLYPHAPEAYVDL